MTALAAGRLTPRRGDTAVIDLLSYPMESATTVYAGGIVALNTSGYLVPASADVTLKVVGVAQETVVNAGAAAAKKCPVRRGTFAFASAGSGDQLAQDDVGKVVYAQDDQTVALLGTARPVAGKLVEYTDSLFWVEILGAGGGADAITDLSLPAIVTLTDSTGLSGTHDDTLAATATVTAPAAYTAHASGSTPVTSNAATDLDTTAAALANVRLRLADAVAVINVLSQNQSDLAQKVIEIVAKLVAAGITV